MCMEGGARVEGGCRTREDFLPRLPDMSRKYQPLRRDVANVSLAISMDLTPLFHWNTKMVFVYAYAEWPSKNNAVNQIVLWDAIAQSADDAVLEFPALGAEYRLSDQGFGLRGKTLNLTVVYNRIPHTGPLEWREYPMPSFTMPADYSQ